MRCAPVLCAIAIVLAGGVARAQDAPDIDLTLIAGGWTHDMILPQNDNVAVGALTLKGHWSPVASIDLDGQVFGIIASGDEGRRGQINLRKAYATLSTGRLILRVGRQVENWGRADRLNPTDNLSPRDYTVLTSDDADQRLGLTMVRADLALSNSVSVIANWIPEFRSTRLLTPLPSAVAKDSRGWDAGQFALKLDHSGGALDWSLSYFQGRDPVLDLAASASGLVQKFNQVRVYGGDLAATTGHFGLRVEAAYTATVFDPVRNPLARRPEFWLVFGADRTIASVYTNVQFSARRVFDYKSSTPVPLAAARQRIDALRYQQDETQFGVTLNLRKSWDDGRWSVEFSGLYYFEQSQGLIRINVRTQVSPNVTLHLKAQKFYGATASYFDTIRSTSSVGLEVRLAL